MAEPSATIGFFPTAPPLRREQAAFQNFLHNTAPEPPPPVAIFYAKHMGDRFVKSYEIGFVRYFKELREQPWKGVLAATVSLTLGLLFTAFRSHRHLIEAAFLIGFLGYPFMAALRHFPKLAEAYQLAKEGEPTRARQTFEKSFDELVFRILHVYLKPLAMAGLVFYPLLNLRRSLRWVNKKTAVRGIRWIGSRPIGFKKRLRSGLETLRRSLVTLSESKPLKMLDRFAVRLDRWGDGLVAAISPQFSKYKEKLPFFERLSSFP